MALLERASGPYQPPPPSLKTLPIGTGRYTFLRTCRPRKAVPKDCLDKEPRAGIEPATSALPRLSGAARCAALALYRLSYRGDLALTRPCHVQMLQPWHTLGVPGCSLCCAPGDL